MIAKIVANIKLFHMSKLAQLFENLFVEIFKVFRDSLLIQNTRIPVRCDDLGNRILIHVANQNCLTEDWFIVQS